MRKCMKCLAFAGILLFVISTGAAAMNPAPETARVPIIMYHSLAGAGRSTSISGACFEADLQYLQAHGYQTVTLQALVDFVHHGIPLPERPVVLTFDDGYYNNYSVGLPLVRAYSMPIVVSIIGKDTEIWSGIPSKDLKDGHVTWAEIGEMAESSFVEIANHTWDLHKHEGGRKGAAMRAGEDVGQYRAVLLEDLGRLQSALLERAGVTPLGFVFPFGRLSSEATEILREMGFLVSVSCRDGVNVLTRGDPLCLFELRRFERTPERSVREILEKA